MLEINGWWLHIEVSKVQLLTQGYIVSVRGNCKVFQMFNNNNNN